MKKKYNIALIPSSKSQDIIDISKNFTTIADQYILGENSLPHVTICQFQSDEKAIKNIWDLICKMLSEYSIALNFNDFSCISFDKTISWVSLIPDHRSSLESLHSSVCSLINEPINISYDPHMTLLNTKDIEYKIKVANLEKFYVPISDIFVLSVGKCDAIGQFTRLLWHLPV